VKNCPTGALSAGFLLRRDKPEEAVDSETTESE